MQLWQWHSSWFEGTFLQSQLQMNILTKEHTDSGGGDVTDWNGRRWVLGDCITPRIVCLRFCLWHKGYYGQVRKKKMLLFWLPSRMVLFWTEITRRMESYCSALQIQKPPHVCVQLGLIMIHTQFYHCFKGLPLTPSLPSLYYGLTQLIFAFRILRAPAFPTLSLLVCYLLITQFLFLSLK